MSKDCPCAAQSEPWHTLPVEIVVSAPRIHPWILKLPGSQIISSINTTHWGLKIGSGYHDLKMRGLYQTKPDVVFAATLAARDERAISRSIPIGRTHFTNEEVRCLAMHRLLHTSWYHFWYDNCQKFVVNELAQHIVCLECSDDDHNFESKARLNALSLLAELRPLETANVVGTALTFLVDWSFGMTVVTATTTAGLPWALTRLLSTFSVLCLFSYYDDQRHTEMEENDEIFQDVEPRIGATGMHPGSAEMETTSEKSLWLQSCIRDGKSLLLSENGESSIIDEATTGISKRAENDRDDSVLLDSILFITLSLVGYSLLKVLALGRLGQAVVLLTMTYTILCFRKPQRRFPYSRPTRKGRLAVDGPCRTCSMYSRLRSWRTALCKEVRHGASSKPPTQSHGTILRWSDEDESYYRLRMVVSLALIMLLGRTLALTEHIRLQFAVQLLLSPFSPVTPYGNMIRLQVISIYLIYGFLEITFAGVVFITNN